MAKKRNGKQRHASPTKPAVLVVEQTLQPGDVILIYRFSRGKIGVRHPPGVRVLRPGDNISEK